MASEAALSLLIQLRDEASAGIAALGGNVEQLGRQAEQQQGMFGRLFGVVSGAGVAAFAGMAVGAAGAATAGFSLNNAMEMTSAKINAFTKDGAKTADILAMIQERASKTPFEFQAMADAAAALIPVSKASGVGLEDLIAKAEILAASNPAEGLEGAAFALKEAVSGDFTSVIERFNLPKQYLNELKAQGVPAAEAVSMAMQQLGLDSDLVSNLAETASGRWSTFKDTLQGLAATATKPIFTMFSTGLGQVNGLLEAAAPTLTAVATAIGEGLASGIQSAAIFFRDLWASAQPTIGLLYSAGSAIAAFVAGTGDLGTVADFLIDLFGVTLGGGIADFIGMITDAGNAIFNFVSGATGFVGLASSLMEIFGPTIGSLIAQAVSVLNDYATVWIDLGTTIYNVVSALMGGDLAGAWAALTGGIAQVVTDYQTYAANLAALLWSLATTIGQAVLTWGAALVDWIAPYIPIALGYLQVFATQIWAWVVAQAPILYQQVLTWGAALVDWITPYIGLALTMLGTFAASIWTWIGAQAPGFIAQLAAWGAAFVDWISPYIGLALGALAGFGSAILSWIGSQASALGAQIATWGAALVEWIPGATANFLAAWPGILSGLLDQLASWVGPVLAQLATLGAAIVGWIATQGPIFLAQLLTWGVQFIGWIVPQIPGIIAALGGITGAILLFIAETAGMIAAKIVIWAVSMLGWVAKNVLPALPGMLGSILSSIVSWILGPANTGILNAALSIGKALADGIRSGISKAWNGLMAWIAAQVAKIPEPIRAALKIGSPSRVMAEVVGLPIAQGIALGFSQGMPKVTTNLVNGVAGLMEKVASAVENGSKALAAVSGFQGSSGSGLSGFLAAIKDMAIQFNDAAVALGGRILGTATRFADTIGKVTAPIDTALKALGGLVDFVAPARTNISAFIASMYVLLNALNNMAAMFESKAIKAAATFAEGAGKMLAVVGPAIDALKKLPDLVVPAQSQVNAFGESLFLIVRELLNVAALFAEQSLKAGAAFGEAGAKLIAVVGPAIDALKKLPELVVPADGALAVFGDALTRTVQTLIGVAALFAQEAVDAAAKFAEGAGKVLGVLKNGVDGLNAVREFGPIGYEAITAFGMAVDQMVALMAQVADDVGVTATEAAAKFSEGAGKVLGILKSGVDGLAGVRDLGPIGYEAIETFTMAVDQIVAYMAMAAEDVGVAAVEAAARFAGGAGAVLAIVKNGVDGLLVLRDLGPIGYEAIESFTMAVDQIVAYMAMAAEDVGVAATEAAAKFSEGAGKVLAIVKSGVEGLVGLRDLGPVGVTSITRFVMAVDQIVAYMAMAAEDVGVAAADAAAAFAAGAGKVLALLKTGVDGLTSLATFAAPAPKAIQAFGAAIVAVLRQIELVSATFSAEAVVTAAAFSANVSTVVSQIKNALQSFASLGDTTVKPAVLGAFMQAAQSLIAQMAAYLPPNAEVIGSNTIVGLINGIVGQRSNLIAAMTNTVLAAVQAAQATLGIASPSKVFEQLGQYTGMGMAGGMNAMQPAVASAGAGLGMAAVGGASGGVGSSRGSGAGGPINITFAAGAIAINGVQGGLNDKHLKTLAGYIKEDIGADMRGR